MQTRVFINRSKLHEHYDRISGWRRLWNLRQMLSPGNGLLVRKDYVSCSVFSSYPLWRPGLNYQMFPSLFLTPTQYNNNSTVPGIGSKPTDYWCGLISDFCCKCSGTMITYLSLLVVSLPILKSNVEICQSHSFFFINFRDSIHWVISLGDEFIKESFVFIL